MKKTFFFFLLLVSAVCCGAAEFEIQYQGDGAYTSVKPYAHSYPDSSSPAGTNGLIFNSNLNSKLKLTDEFTLTLDHRLSGFNNSKVLPESNFAFDNTLSGGLFFTKFGDFQTVVTSFLFNDAKAIAVPYYQPGMEITPKSLTALDIGWGAEFGVFHTDLQTTTFNYKFKMYPQNQYTDTTEQCGDNRRDADLWALLNAGIDIPLDMAVNAGWDFKNDINGNDFYNYNKYWLGCTGDHKLNRNKIMLTWELQEQFIKSKMMEESGYADGLTTDIMMRMIWRKSSDLFVKGQISIDIADKLFKQFYEFQLRKTWNERSSFDILYFATNGVLFPRQALGLESTLRLFKHFGVNPAVSFYLSQLPSESKFRYYRSDYKCELLFPLIDRIDLFTGLNISHYDRHPFFTSRSTVTAGIRTW